MRIFVGGATATGKTDLAVELCKKLNGELISADSMQIYKDMDIGTAKEKSEQLGIIEHCIDIVEPYAQFSVVDYREIAEKVISDIENRGKTPIICGGTGFYFNSLIYNYDFGGNNSYDEELAKKIRLELNNTLQMPDGDKVLYEKLMSLDKVSAEKIHINNTKRLIRALEVCILTGNPFSSQNDTKSYRTKDFKLFVINYADRDVLKKRIAYRVDKMISMGLEEEIRGLIEKGITFDMQSMQAIGYKEWKGYFNKEIGLQEVRDLIVKNTRAYAKRQQTWFNNQYDDKVIINGEMTAEQRLEYALDNILK